MASHPSLRSVLIVLLALTVLFARMGNAHLHLCFDGAEPSSSVHILDFDFHDENMASVASKSAPHQDLNISLVTNELSKTNKLNADDIALLAAVLALFGLLIFSKSAAPIGYTRHYVTAPQYLRPPLRGPPV
jgi:hypothetical protein